jgi:hypothetical protein
MACVSYLGAFIQVLPYDYGRRSIGSFFFLQRKEREAGHKHIHTSTPPFNESYLLMFFLSRQNNQEKKYTHFTLTNLYTYTHLGQLFPDFPFLETMRVYISIPTVYYIYLSLSTYIRMCMPYRKARRIDENPIPFVQDHTR